MLKKLGALVVVLTVVCSMQLAFAKEKKASTKQNRVEGIVVRHNADKSMLTVRERDLNAQKTVHYDSSTKWASQFHGSKKVNDIQPSEVKDGDQVICLGSYDDKGDFHASYISKRLSHSPK